MQQQQTSKKNIIIVVVLILIGAGVFFFMQGSPTDVDPSLSIDGAEGSVDANASAVRVLSLLNQIKNIKIDSAFFTSQSYSSLVDHTVPIYEQSVGKSNPFLNPNPRPVTR